MTRYFVECAYRGTNYAGWQRQPNATSVQQVIEEAFSTVLRLPVSITGCGRTDAGVHASRYIFHFDASDDLPDRFTHRINGLLPEDIAIYSYWRVDERLHARFSATSRAYTYIISRHKDPFNINQVYRYPHLDKINERALVEAAKLVLEYDEFRPFCKTKSDAKTMICEVNESYWVIDEDYLKYHIKANRFLRGMVRLIVGMCLNVAVGDIEISAVRDALIHQEPLSRSWSVPADGLFLSAVDYPSQVNN